MADDDTFTTTSAVGRRVMGALPHANAYGLGGGLRRIERVADRVVSDGTERVPSAPVHERLER